MRNRTYRECMEVARTWAKNSHCSRRHVGCVLADDVPKLVAYACNQGVAGQKCPPVHTADECVTLHAEAAAIANCAATGTNTEGLTVYVTCAPCAPCARLLVAAGISKLVYSDEYRNNDGLAVFRAAGIPIVRMEVA